MAYRSESGGAITDEASALLLSEYNQRMRLYKLGFFEPLENLDCIKAEIFCFIGAEIDKIREEDLKKKTKKR